MQTHNPLLLLLDEIATDPRRAPLLGAEPSWLIRQGELPEPSAARLKRLMKTVGAANLGELPLRLLGAYIPSGARQELRELSADLARTFESLAEHLPLDPKHVCTPFYLTDESELRRWAAGQGVEDCLEHAVRVLAQVGAEREYWYHAETVRELPENLSVCEAHVGSAQARWRRALVKRRPYLDDANITRSVRELSSRHLLRAAAVRRAFAERRQAGQRASMTEDEHVTSLVRQLESVLASQPCSAPELLVLQNLYFDRAGTLHAAYVEMQPSGETALGHVSLELRTWEAGHVTLGCSCETPLACPHRAVLLDRAISELSTPGSGVRSWASVPGWTRLFTALDAATSARAATRDLAGAERIAWRVIEYEALSLVPVVQKRTKRGGYSKGKKQDPIEVRRSPLMDSLDERDREVVELLATESSLHGSRRLLFRALSLLAGHPRLHFDQDQRPYSVAHAVFSVTLQPADGGYHLQLLLDDVEVDAQVLLHVSEGTWYVCYPDCSGARILLCELSPESHAMVAQLARHGSFLPDYALGELVRRVPELQEHVDIVLPRELLGRRVAADERLHVDLCQVADDAVEVTLSFRPLAGGPRLSPGRGVSRLVTASDVRRTHVLRDLSAERRQADSLLSAPMLSESRALAPYARRVEGVGRIVELLAELEGREDLVVSWAGDELELVARLSPASLKLRSEQRTGALWLGGSADVDGKTVQLSLLLDAARRGQRWVVLGPRRFALLEERLTRKLEAIDALVHEKKNGALLPPALAPQLATVLEELSVQDDGALARAVERARAADALAPELPRGLEADLRPYQIDGFRWLSRMASWGVGACLADDMGLGKTLQCLAALLSRASLGPALIVAPTSLCGNWLAEARRFAPSLQFRHFAGASRKGQLENLGTNDVLIASYEVVTRDISELEACTFATLVLDEAQAIKNAKSQRAQAMRRLQAQWRLALTGTPLENHLGELWSLFRVLEPDLLGGWSDFAARFVKPIEAQGDRARLEALRGRMAPFILRRTKSEVLPDLPPRIDVVRRVSLSRGERELYEQARIAALARFEQGGQQGRIELLSALTRLRRLVCHPRLYDETTSAGSSKLEALLEILDQLASEQRRALIFSQFTSFLELVRERLHSAGLSTQYLDGSTPPSERTKRVEAFQNGEGDVFLISLKAGGVGLNLTAADTAILLDPWWNPAAEDQASSRAHRIGQTLPVTVIRLIAERTIEERVLAMHDAKRALAEQVLEGTGAGARLSDDELLDLLADSASAEPEPVRRERQGRRRAARSRANVQRTT